MTSHHVAGETSTAAGRTGPRSARVTAVIVAHDGTRWLPNLFSALETSTRFPDHLVAVDTGSTDDTDAAAGRRPGVSSAVHSARPRRSASAPPSQHALDLTDPRPKTVDGLDLVAARRLRAGTGRAGAAARRRRVRPGISVVGGRIRAWPRARRLLEVGVTVDRDRPPRDRRRDRRVRPGPARRTA